MAGVSSSMILAEHVSWYSTLLLALMLAMNCCEPSDEVYQDAGQAVWHRSGGEFANKVRPCDEIYVVREGETLHTISEKCGDPYIVEENPHIHDPDDVFPGLVIRINPFKYS
ncbi:uncharacterized protein LOC116208169 [Punica granatum]|uniref:LysM domain-containing protein n=2 Tax=Punica granatum TaxID=22663 RepID=A0A218XC60_PUNGR|nr:uncharacterized protein LOC116208169 [Punica granatum]OWM82517.1 hypothetical protein CDL15_Pgr002092 [Punica granatum]PKI32111.1 hypothetical protein CRG98_047502 [Punica granatum]